MTVRAWSGIVRTAVKPWTRASRVSVSVQPDTLENTARQVGLIITCMFQREQGTCTLWADTCRRNRTGRIRTCI